MSSIPTIPITLIGDEVHFLAYVIGPKLEEYGRPDDDFRDRLTMELLEAQRRGLQMLTVEVTAEDAGHFASALTLLAESVRDRTPFSIPHVSPDAWFRGKSGDLFERAAWLKDQVRSASR